MTNAGQDKQGVDRLFADPMPMRRIDAHDIGLLRLSRLIPENAVEPGVYVLCSVLGDDAIVALRAKMRAGFNATIGVFVHRNL